MADKTYDFQSRKIDSEIERLNKEKAKLRVVCDHNDPETGKLDTLTLIDKQHGLWRCERCKEVFHLDLLTRESLNCSYGFIHDMISQLKCLTGGKELDTAVTVKLGELLFNLKEAINLYDNLIINAGKKKNKNRNRDYNNNNNGSGRYGASALSTRR